MKKFFSFLFYCFLFGTIFTIFAIWFVVLYYNDRLPDIEKINAYNPPLTSRLYSVDGVLLKEYAEEKRLFVSIENVPELVKQAFIAAEDNNFYKDLYKEEELNSDALYNQNVAVYNMIIDMKKYIADAKRMNKAKMIDMLNEMLNQIDNY